MNNQQIFYSCVFLLFFIFYQMNAEKPYVFHFPPRIIIFDLDCLVWPFWTGCTELKKPIKLTPDGQLIDADGIRLKPYKAVPGILRSLKKSNFEMAVVGRTGEEVLDKYNWREFFRYIILEPGPKVNHIAKLVNLTGCKSSDLLFFSRTREELEAVKNSDLETYVCCLGLPSMKKVQEELRNYLLIQQKLAEDYVDKQNSS
ncbi:magnesium-dependent phosphatase 1-like isoform X2 [Lycorma delicatula]|uniref:magnesium-dependent phosphatase 1-like isoform X2 n=1 Tax=Lycorma delicatula TaxID=130591 RepID=UPI003F51386A